MFVPQILVSAPRSRLLAAGLLVVLAGCGQKGPLFLPTGDVAAGRATLPETLAPSTGSGTAVVPTTAASGLPPTGTANPVRQP